MKHFVLSSIVNIAVLLSHTSQISNQSGKHLTLRDYNIDLDKQLWTYSFDFDDSVHHSEYLSYFCFDDLSLLNLESASALFENDIDSTCLIFDRVLSKYYLIGDNTGYFPLFYSFDSLNGSSSSFIFTSDVILASRMGFYNLDSLCCGNVIEIDSNLLEITSFFDKRQFFRKEIYYTNSISLNSYVLTSMAFSQINLLDFGRFIVENDGHRHASAFLLCMLANSGLPMYIVDSMTSIGSIISQPVELKYWFEYGKQLKLDSNMNIDSFVENDTGSLIALVSEQWSICSLALSRNATVIDFDIGESERSLKKYFRSIFCNILGVSILSPFRNAHFSRMIWSTEHPLSEFASMVNWMFSSSICKDYSLYFNEYRSISFDISPNEIEIYSRIHALDEKQPSSLFQLYQSASRIVTSDGYITVLMVTSGYKELFQNFLEFAKDLKSFLIISPHEDIINIATSYGMGVYRFKKLLSNRSVSAEASFGSFDYQDLMLFRTKTVLNLLLLGFKVIIADIDAVWKDNPFTILQDQTMGMNGYDIGVTIDSREICGCFVVLNNSLQGIRFWNSVYAAHLELVDSARQNDFRLQNFSDSEQKILTHFIFEGGYTHPISIRILPAAFFPSGLDYFNLNLVSNPAVIHNNFIIGKSVKNYRFQRHGLWNLENNSLGKWNSKYLTSVVNRTIPTLQLILPIHDSIVSSNHVLVQVLTENDVLSTGKLWMSADPPSFIHFQSMGVFDLNLSYDSPVVISMMPILDDSNIDMSVDIGINRSVFSFDFGGNETLIAMAHANVIESLIDIPKGFSNYQVTEETPSSFKIRYFIKVLAFNRPESLRRLLLSLSMADYGNETVSLDILIDGNRTFDEGIIVSKVEEMALEFNWCCGIKTVYRYPTNQGLVRQWYNSWDPEIDTDVAFVFEDDTEVSPLFFKWSQMAVIKYYQSNIEEQELHIALLEAIRMDIAANNSDPDRFSFLNQFLEIHAGKPLLYGICLQKQHLDPSHYPKRLRIENGHRPYLHSLIGSWGPLFFPLPWKAFQEWWVWQSNLAFQQQSFFPLTENIVVNYFYKSNNYIWTPWIIRFAYETGAKCLYTNFEDEWALVVNHREKGENYHETKGKISMLLGLDEQSKFGLRSSTCRMEAMFNYLPSFDELSRHQYDLNGRRLGSFGIKRPFDPHRLSISNPYFARRPILKHEDFINVMINKSLYSFLSKDPYYWHICAEKIDGILRPFAQVVHSIDSPLQTLLGFYGISSLPLNLLAKQSLNGSAEQETLVSINYHWYNRALICDDKNLTSLVELFFQIEYLVVLGECTTAPTDILSSSSDLDSTHFSLIGDVCLEIGAGLGMTIFKRKESLPSDWLNCRQAMTLRFPNSIIATDYACRRYRSAFD